MWGIIENANFYLKNDWGKFVNWDNNVKKKFLGGIY
jgi:hypothetical protein